MKSLVTWMRAFGTWITLWKGFSLVSHNGIRHSAVASAKLIRDSISSQSKCRAWSQCPLVRQSHTAQLAGHYPRWLNSSLRYKHKSMMKMKDSIRQDPGPGELKTWVPDLLKTGMSITPGGAMKVLGIECCSPTHIYLPSYQWSHTTISPQGGDRSPAASSRAVNNPSGMTHVHLNKQMNATIHNN